MSTTDAPSLPLDPRLWTEEQRRQHNEACEERARVRQETPLGQELQRLADHYNNHTTSGGEPA